MKPKKVIEVLERMQEINKQLKNDEVVKAIDHAINCVGAIEQIKWERDIAISQLHELGYDLGEKIWYDMLEDKPKEDEDVLVQLDDSYDIAHYEGVVYATDEKETEIWGFEHCEYTKDELEDFYKVHRWRKIRSDKEW